ncbi:thermonuclease family protein [Sphingomonas psychrotolerans]|uniref:Thermonuclease family protein n=1 Tax=Sphingomonas psychrotolerans TaxID=1327635 RepID=A0ABU3N702_9SPHN|nr:thermonuclease family protein [Sphingomonas psychrotolerans]MDT8760305.1 thermonuclease family protein [Sphingomonas psychrotolerans]
MPEAPRRRRITPQALLAGLAIAGALGFGWTSADRVAGVRVSVPDPATSPRRSEAPPPTRRFALCHSGGGRNCVVDGDTFWLDGEKIRIADIDTPETHPPRCPAEAELGARATRRLQALLSAGPITLAVPDRATDRYGRKLRVVLRGGESLGGMLVAEGLARPWEGRRRPWC